MSNLSHSHHYQLDYDCLNNTTLVIKIVDCPSFNSVFGVTITNVCMNC